MSHSLDHHSTDYQHGSKGVEVFVGGLARSLTEDRVHKVFAACGEIIDMRLIKDQKGSLKGFGFIRFATKEAADKAVKNLSGSLLDGKKIGVLPSAAQDTLFLGNLNKGWSNDDFNRVIRQVFPDVVTVDVALPLSGSDGGPGKKFKNRGFGFVKFSSHASAARAFRAGSKPDFVLGGTLHPSVQWAEEDPEADPDELAKIKIAFVRNLPSTADETFLRNFFVPFGKVDKVVVSGKGDSSVGFVHFAQRSHLDNAIKGLNDRIVQGPKGGPSFKLQVEVARPMDKKRKRVYEDPQNFQPHEILIKPNLRYDPVSNSFNGHEETLQKEPVITDPYEAAVLLLPVAVRERLLRILRLGIATRFDIEVESLNNLAELPESTAITVLDQFMLSGSDKHDKGAYLASLISRYQVDKLGPSQPQPLNFSRLRDPNPNIREPVGLSNIREPIGLSNIREPVGLSNRMHISAVDSLALHVDQNVPRSDTYTSRYPPLYSDYRSSRPTPPGVLRTTEERSPLPFHEIPGSSSSTTAPPYSRYLVKSHIPPAYANMEKMSPNPSHQIPGSSSMPFSKPIQDPYRIPNPSLTYAKSSVDPLPAPSGDRVDRLATRPQMRFDPFTGQPYKFDPFTGEPIVPESLPRQYGI